MKTLLKWLIVAVCLLCVSCHPHLGHCAAEPPVTLIIPFGQGGAVDVASRILAEYWEKKYGQQTQLVYFPGGSGNPAMLELEKAPADGNTMAFVSAYTYAAASQISPTDTSLYDLTPIGQVSVMWLTLGVGRLSPARSVDQLFQTIRSREGRIFYGTHSALSPQRLFMLRLVRKIAPDLESSVQHVSLGSGFEVCQALLAGRVYAGFGVLANLQEAVATGDVRLLAVSSPARLPEHPDVPTFGELYGPEFVLGSPHGLVTLAGAPAERVATLRERLATAMADPQVQERFEAAGIPPVYEDAATFQRTLERVWTDIAGLIRSGKL